MEKNPGPRRASDSLSPCAPPSSVRQEQTELLDCKELPYGDKGTVSGLGIPSGASVLVHQRDRMPRQDTGVLAEKDEPVQEV